MKIGRSISLAVIMIFLFSNPQESIASKNSPNVLTNKKQNNISLESIITQRNRRMGQRPGRRGRMSGPRKGPSLNRRPQIGTRRSGNPNQGNRGRMMQRRRMQRQGQPTDQNSGKPPLAAGTGSGTNEVQSGQGMGEVTPDSQPPNRGPQFRKKMRKARRNKARQRMQRRRMQRQGQPMDQKRRQAGKNEPGKRGGPRGNP